MVVREISFTIIVEKKLLQSSTYHNHDFAKIQDNK